MKKRFLKKKKMICLLFNG